MNKLITYFLLSFYFHSGFSQPINHLTMSLENCSMPAANIIRFDLDVVSDGDSASDLRPAAFQYGINFDTCILQIGATIIPSFIVGSSDFSWLNINNPFSYLASNVPNHIRIVAGAVSGGNTGNTLIVGHKYRVGSFLLTSTSNFTFCCPNFNLQDTPAASHTATAAVIWIGNDPSSTIFDISGPGNNDIDPQHDHQRTVLVTCSSCITGLNDNNNTFGLTVYPNPVTQNLFVKLNESTSSVFLKIYNMIGELKYSVISDDRLPILNLGELPDGVYFVEVSTTKEQSQDRSSLSSINVIRVSNFKFINNETDHLINSTYPWNSSRFPKKLVA